MLKISKANCGRARTAAGNLSRSSLPGIVRNDRLADDWAERNRGLSPTLRRGVVLAGVADDGKRHRHVARTNREPGLPSGRGEHRYDQAARSPPHTITRNCPDGKLVSTGRGASERFRAWESRAGTTSRVGASKRLMGSDGAATSGATAVAGPLSVVRQATGAGDRIQDVG